ncbi:hypothetical protein EV1_040339 [Malus domestica]
MPRGFQPPKFMQFDGKGNPKHVAHFIETCNNVGTNGDYIVRQFVRLLKGNVFYWYTDLKPESINNWDQLEREFFNCFYNIRCTVSMMELTSMKQWKDEPVINYINRWHSLKLATHSHDMELSIANHGKKKPIIDFKKDKVFAPKVDKTGKKPANESFFVNTPLRPPMCLSRSPPRTK